MAPSSSPPPTPRRNFIVEPLETTVRSSKKSDRHHSFRARDDDVASGTTTSKRTQTDEGGHLQTPPSTPPSAPLHESSERLFGTNENGLALSKCLSSSPASPAEHTEMNGNKKTKDSISPRRQHLPEPVETSTRSSRKILPQPVEVSSPGSRKKQRAAEKERPSSATKRFLPQPIETAIHHRRPEAGQDDKDNSRQSVSKTAKHSAGRKFEPELIETVRGSRTRWQAEVSPRFASDGGSGPLAMHPHLKSMFPPAPPTNTPAAGIETAPQLHESKFSAANLAKRQEKQHCYTVPGLPPIESASSEESGESRSEQGSSPASARESLSGLHARDRFDEKFSAYMLSLAARAAEKQLREQAMAAYPNEMVHEPVDHFAMSDESRRPSMDTGTLSIDAILDMRKFRRESAADLELELEHMRRHHDEQDRLRELQAADIGQSQFSAAAIAAKLGNPPNERGERTGAHQSGIGITQMKSAASPPMLGDDLIFPQSLSPKTTRCDPDQFPIPRTGSMRSNDSKESSGLWCINMQVQNQCESGLWMGLCKEQSNSDAISGLGSTRSGILTPNPYREDSFGDGMHPDEGSRRRQLPSIPPSLDDNSPTDCLDKRLWREKRAEEEFDDSFVTQIYNYLSLGFPSLAHPFDHELSKISRISVAEIRRDDQASDAQGYIGTPEGPGEDGAIRLERIRWVALKLYIKEWFRQSSEMAGNAPDDDWGARVRRGSWAW